MNIDLTGKTAVITGGGGILCGMFAHKLAECGASIAVLDLKPELAETVAASIRQKGGEAKAFACNVMDPQSIRECEEQVREAFGEYHILINGAGGAPAASCTTREYADLESIDMGREQENTLFNLPPEIVSSVMELNCMGTFNVTQVFAKRMAGLPGATIINMSSMSAILPLTKQVAYSAGKAAVSNLTKWLAVHLANLGIRVNAIAPGFFSTTINRHLLFAADGTPAPRTAKIVSGTPMGRFGEPEELLGALMFLCDSEASGFVTGVVLPVDGGFSAYSGV